MECSVCSKHLKMEAGMDWSNNSSSVTLFSVYKRSSVHDIVVAKSGALLVCISRQICRGAAHGKSKRVYDYARCHSPFPAPCFRSYIYPTPSTGQQEYLCRLRSLCRFILMVTVTLISRYPGCFNVTSFARPYCHRRSQ